MPPRASATQKKSPSKSSNRYDYTEISKVQLTSDEKINLYGVIVDAGFPHQFITKNNSEKLFKCTLKVIDPTHNAKGQFAQIVMYANKFEDLPIVQRLGDIIRVHRAKIRKFDKYNGKQNIRQFVANMQQTSSWSLFSTDKTDPNGDVPKYPCNCFEHSGKNFTIDKQDPLIFNKLKNWSQTYFSNNNIEGGDKTKALNVCHKEENNDFDVNAKIIQMFGIDEYHSELKLKDASGSVYYTLALNAKFPHLKNGSVIRIRSATVCTTSSKKVLVLQHYSNIMSHISTSKLAASLSSKVKDSAIDASALKSTAPVVLTEIDKKHAALETKTFQDLFHCQDLSTNTFRVCFYVTRIEPGSAVEACKMYNKDAKKSASVKNNKGGDMIYQVQFLAKDVSTQHNNNVYKILLYTHEGLGSNFFQQKATNLSADSKAEGKVNSAFKNLLRFNSWVDAVVERRNGYYFIKDTRMIY